jgi:hypothetical protein
MVWAHGIMAPRAGRGGATSGATSQSPPTRRGSAAGAKVPKHRMSRPSRRGVPEHTWSALHSMHMHGHPLRAPQRHGARSKQQARVAETPSCYPYSTVSPDHQAGTGVPPRNPGIRPNFQVQHPLCPACGLTLPQVLESCGVQPFMGGGTRHQIQSPKRHPKSTTEDPRGARSPGTKTKKRFLDTGRSSELLELGARS